MSGEAWQDAPAVVLDNGSGILKCGYAGDEAPRVVFPSVVGALRQHSPSSPGSPRLIGDAALDSKGVTLRYPVDHGIVSDWDGMEAIWRHAFHELHANPADQAVLLTEAPMNPKSNREKMAEVLFEKIGAPAMQIQVQAVLALYPAGRTTGCVLDSGDGVTHCVPVYEGHALPTAMRRLDLAGRDVTEWLMELLSDETGRPFTTTADHESARRIKESLSYVALDFDAEMDKVEAGGDAAAEISKQFTLPDGNVIDVGRARFASTEVMFDPSVAEKQTPSLQQVIHEAIGECAIDIRRSMLRDIFLSGGNTMFPGMADRLRKEVQALTNKKTHDDVRVVAVGERKYVVWMGGALLASLSSFSSEWITRQEYEEEGAQVIHRRCNVHDFVTK